MESRPAASDPVRISAVSSAGGAVPIRTVASRLGGSPSSPLRRLATVGPRWRPCSRRRAASHARRASAPIADSIPHALAPLIRNPPRRSLDAQGRTPAGGLQGPRRFFGFFAPMRCAREQREKLTSGDFHFHARLRFLPCRHARTACDSRGARHATGAGLRV